MAGWDSGWLGFRQLHETTHEAKIMTTEMIAHEWAQRQEPGVRNANSTGNFEYEGKNLYCYGNLIAAFAEGVHDGEPVVLIRPGISIKRGWAPNYGSMVWRATRHYPNRFEVRFLQGADRHTLNLEDFMAQALKAGSRLAKPRVRCWQSEPYSYKENTPAQICRKRINLVPGLFETARRYAGVFGLVLPSLDEMIRDIIANIRTAFAREKDPAVLARRAKAKVRRDKQEASKHEAFLAWARGDGPRPALRLYSRNSQEYRVIQSDIWQNAHKNDIAEWLSGEGHFPLLHTITLLRLKPGAPETVQTSHGAEVPLDHAKRLFAKLLECRAAWRSWRPNGHKLPVGGFTVTRIEPDGGFTAGCHTFKWTEVERFARAIGVLA